MTEFCIQNIDKVDCDGNVSLLRRSRGSVPAVEKYMAVAPTQSAAAGFTPRDVFTTEGALIFKIDREVSSRCLRRSRGASHRTTTGLRSTMWAHLAST